MMHNKAYQEYLLKYAIPFDAFFHQSTFFL